MNAMPAWITEPLWVALAILCLLVLLTLVYRWGAWRTRRHEQRRIAKNRTMGRQGEHVAVRILEDAGYRLLDDQISGKTRVEIDGRSASFTVRADFLVEREHQRFIAEAKSTEHTARLSNRDTRRQLLEYAHAFEVEGLLLINTDARTIHTVRFPRR